MPISVLFSTILAAAMFFAPMQTPAPQQPVFSADVRLVRVLATVRNPQGQLVGALTRDDFTVFDSGLRQEVAVFERQTAQPLSVTLLVDTSLSTAKDLRYETDSVSRFLRAVYAEGDPRDAVSIYSFNYDVTLLAGFTRSRQRLDDAMKWLQPHSGTSLYDAIYLACQNLEIREGRRVLIVVTDGGDTTSVHMENFLSACRSRNEKELHDPLSNDYLSASLCHLANISYRVGRKLTLEAGPKFTGDAEATRMLTRDAYRKPYVV